jgi:hypothetical protein
MTAFFCNFPLTLRALFSDAHISRPAGPLRIACFSLCEPHAHFGGFFLF